MAVSFTIVDETIQLTDGNWLREATFDPTPGFIDLDADVENVNLGDLDLSEGFDWSATLDLDVIGDFNDVEEVLIVTVEEEETDESISQLFDDATADDGIFAGESTGPTDGTTEINGVINPLIGAHWQTQGNVAINGHQPNFNPADPTFTQDDIVDIQNNEALFTADEEPVQLSGDLSSFIGNSDVDFNFEIADATAAVVGVDFAQIEMEVNVSTEWSGNAISNVVFYLDCEGVIEKIQIDDWGDLTEVYTSTESLDFSEETILDLAVACGIEGDCDFIGMTIKAGGNQETGLGLKRNQIGGEGEIIAIDETTVENNYGKQNDIDWTVSAVNVIDGFVII